MTTMVPVAEDAAEKKPIAVGVDTHLEEHVAVALDDLGRRLGEKQVPAAASGYAELLKWADELGRPATFGIEGAGSFGAGVQPRYVKKRATYSY